MGYALRDDKRYTYGDYRTWPEDVRYELIAGSAYLMAPAPTVDHQTLAFEVGHQIRRALEGHPCRVLVAPVDVMLNADPARSDDEADTVVQPDVLLVCDPGKLSPRGVRGAPDWVLEVISPSSASHDQTIKLAAYEKAGVKEYWLAHPVDRVLTVYRLEGAAYGRPLVQKLEGETPLAVLPDVVVRWAPIVDLLLPVPDEETGRPVRRL